MTEKQKKLLSKRTLGVTLALLVTGMTQTMAQSELYPQHFDLNEVTLTDGPMRDAMITNAELLLRYDADRLMCPFIREAKLNTVQGGKYYGWTTKHPSFSNWGLSDWSLEGHVGGHYISALAMSYAATGNDSELASLHDQLSARLDYCLSIMKDCQDAYDSNKEGLYGFIGGQPITQIWTGLYKNDPTEFYKYGGWVPFYCQHKVLAGLRDAYVYAGSDLAKTLFKKLADWSVNVVAKLSTETMQSVLNSEHGGMNETLADAYRIFGESKYLVAAKKYSHQTMIDGMQTQSATFLDSRHANTQVPKYIGFERISQLQTSQSTYRKAAMNFWQDVAQNRTVCIGGNSVEEHFLTQNNYSRYISQLDGPETCNSNNMLKLSEDLFDDTHDSKYADFYENTLYNHILATQDPETGGYVYFTTLRPQGYKIYSQVNQGMWCCVGTGMENHAKYGHFIYTHSNDTLFVNLFIPSELNSKDFGIRQETRFPYEQKSTLVITKTGNYTIAVRQPSWLDSQQKGGYKCYKRDWKEGDRIEVELPMSLRTEQCPGLDNYIAFKYGPILLAGQMQSTDLQNEYAGEGRMDHAPGSRGTMKSLISSPLLICEKDTVLRLISATGAMSSTMHAPAYKPSGSYFESNDAITLKPFFDTHHDRYVIYWYQQNEKDFLDSDLGGNEKKLALLSERTLDFVGTGEQQSEAGHLVKYSSGSTTGSHDGEFYRDAQANGYIQYTLTLPDSAQQSDFYALHAPYSIMCRFTTDDKGRMASVYADGVKIGDVTVPSSMASADEYGFYNVEFPLSEEIIKPAGKLKKEIVFKIVASSSTYCPGLYYVRLLKDYINESAQTDYEFHADEWAHTGDAGRVAQNKIAADSSTGSITVKAGTGTNNVCLNMTDSKYTVGSDYKYFIIQATNVKTTAGTAYLWWFNGDNHGGSVPPTSITTDSDGTLFAWDISQSEFSRFYDSPSFRFSQGNTIFGLTSTTGTTVIKHIGFSTTPNTIPTEIKNAPLYSSSSNFGNTQTATYDLNGRPIQEIKADKPYIYIHSGKKYYYQ